jgi:hypothetical protein
VVVVEEEGRDMYSTAVEKDTVRQVLDTDTLQPLAEDVKNISVAL